MREDLLKHAGQGAIAGVAGTCVIQAAVMANQKIAPKTEPPESEEPAKFILWQVEKYLPQKAWMAIPKTAETASGFALSFAYGATFGAVYAAMRPRHPHVLRDGALLGMAVWAIGYLGWLPAARITPPVWKQEPQQLIGPIVEHLAYGIATVAAYELVARTW